LRAGRLICEPRPNFFGRAAQIQLDRMARDLVQNQHGRLFAARQHFAYSERHRGQ
jgi:hypothetical protein